MKITGQRDTDGNLLPFNGEIEVHVFGNNLLDKDGFCWAVKDQYGDWVSPTMLRMGLKTKIEVSD